MEQLIMRWKNNGADCGVPVWEKGFTCRGFDGSAEDIEKWLDIVAHGLTGGRESSPFFTACMTSHKNLEYDKLYIIEYEGKPAATITVICDREKLEGYIHMVACKSEYRGLGIGTQMNRLAVKTLIKEGMKTAYLTTDDFRIPAIKSYLRAGFEPDVSTPEFVSRWNAIYDIIGNKS